MITFKNYLWKKMIATGCSVRVMGHAFDFFGTPCFLDSTVATKPFVSVLGKLNQEWGWHWDTGGQMVAYRLTLGQPVPVERMPLVEWAERQLEQAPSALFGWEAPPAPVGVSRG